MYMTQLESSPGLAIQLKLDNPRGSLLLLTMNTKVFPNIKEDTPFGLVTDNTLDCHSSSSSSGVITGVTNLHSYSFSVEIPIDRIVSATNFPETLFSPVNKLGSARILGKYVCTFVIQQNLMNRLGG